MMHIKIREVKQAGNGYCLNIWPSLYIDVSSTLYLPT